jgi:alanine racemase
MEPKIQNLRPTKAEINLSAFKYNLKKIRKIIGKKPKLMLSVKADAYGHGAIKLTQTTQKEKLADGFAVALIEEGINLRQAKIKLPILVFGSIYPFKSFEPAIKNNLSVTIASMEAAKEIAALAAKLKKTAKCHVKIDTGLGRIGLCKPKAMKVIEFLSNKPYIKIEGIYTHFASADTDAPYTRLQLNRFKNAIGECKKLNIEPAFTHCANSYAMCKNSQTHLNMVRPGLAAYGLIKNFKPVLSLKSAIVFLKTAKKGETISYCRSYKCKKTTRIATIAVGYGDGYPRALSNKGFVLIAGKKCKILGNITMDMTMVDVTNIKDVKIGQQVILLGSQKNEKITADNLAKTAKTISYEITASILPRVPRIYINDI